MSGRFYLLLSLVALAGLAASLVWTFAILFHHAAAHPPIQFALFILTILIGMPAARSKTEGERLLMAAPLGLHPTNRRKALASCFAPYRARTFDRALLRPTSRRVTILGLIVLVPSLLALFLVPFGFFIAAIMSLRRAAWLGDPDAIMLECDWLGFAGPIRTEEGRRLAATALAR
jgi:hypothetical protein